MDRRTTPASPLTVSARVALLVLMAAEEFGVRRSEILAATRLSADQLMEEDARISLHEEQAVWNEAIDRTGIPYLGIDVIRMAPAGTLGLPELLFGSATTLGEALDVAHRYMPLVRDGVDVRIESGRDLVRLVYSISSSNGSSDAVGIEAFLLGALPLMGERCSGRRPAIEHVALSTEAPKTRAGFARLVEVFGTERIEFGASEPAISVQTSALPLRSRDSAPRLHRLLKKHADELMLERPGRFLSRAKRNLLLELEEGRATLSGLARRMAIGERSLQRRLASEGYSFADILEDLRRELAPSYLRDRESGLSEIAFRLGYRSPQSFSRAFQSWTGKPPGKWRRGPPR